MANGLFAGGNGTVINPYLIEDAHDLNAIRNNLSAHYKLIKDIDLNVSPYNTGSGWNPIGTTFSGTLNGNSKAISNLYISNFYDNTGLFSIVGNSARVYDLSVIKANMTITISGKYWGIIAGALSNTAVIERCFSTGKIGGPNKGESVGGLIGRQIGSSICLNSYSHAEVSAQYYGAGLVGRMEHAETTVKNCYSTGRVLCNNWGDGVAGGIGIIVNSFYDRETSGFSTNRGTPLTTQQMKNAQTFIDAGWDLEKLENGTKVWTLKDGQYPKLWFERILKHLIKSSNKIQVLNEGIWTDTGVVTPPTALDFETYGIDDISTVSQEQWNVLQRPIDIYTWTDNIDATSANVSYEQKEFIAPELNITQATESKTKYLISKDNKTTWYAFKNNNWVQVLLENIHEEGMTKEEISAINSSSWSLWFTRGTLDFAIGLFSNIESEKPSVKSLSVDFTPNQAPIIENPTLTPDSVHNEWVEVRAKLIDLEGEKVQYQIHINDNQVYPSTIGEWSPLLNSGHEIFQAYRHPDFMAGDNTLTIKVRDERLKERSWTGNFIVKNNEPYMVYTYNEFGFNGTIGDDDLDKVSYRVSINGNLKFDYLPFEASPRSFNFAWSSSDLNYGVLNTITIEVMDDFGGYVTEQFQVIGTYQGLLFKDTEGNYYTNHMNEILKLLNLGTIIAGQTTEPKKVIVQNNTGHSLENVLISVDKQSLPDNLRLLISESNAPFVGKELISVANAMSHKDEQEMFVSIETSPGRGSEGGFRIAAEGKIIT